MQRQHHVWNFLFCRISTLDLVRKKIEPVAEIISCADPPRPNYPWDLFNGTRPVQFDDEVGEKVEHLVDVARVSDAVNEGHERLTNEGPRSPNHLICPQQYRFGNHDAERSGGFKIHYQF